MVLVFHRSRIVYYPIPKNASTSVKIALFGLETGRDFLREPWRKGKNKTRIHAIYPAERNGGEWRSACKDYLSFAIIRDPVERFLSAYRSRIVVRKDLVRSSRVWMPAIVRNSGAYSRPSLSEFISRYDFYRFACPAVYHHFAPQVSFVGNVVGRLTHVIPISRLNELEGILSEHAGRQIHFPHFSHRARDVFVAPGDDEIAWIRRRFRNDEKMLRPFLGT